MYQAEWTIPAEEEITLFGLGNARNTYILFTIRMRFHSRTQVVMEPSHLKYYMRAQVGSIERPKTERVLRSLQGYVASSH